MRTTIDLPDALFRKAKATAALRGLSLKEFFVAILEEELSGAQKRRLSDFVPSSSPAPTSMTEESTTEVGLAAAIEDFFD